jgi:hypothetical protein
VPRAAEIFPVFLRFVLPFIVIINSKAPKRSGYYLIILAAYLGSIFGHDWSSPGEAQFWAILRPVL